MHDGENFDLYKNWLLTDRPLPAFSEVNCGYFKKIDESTKPSKSILKELKSKSMISKPTTASSLSHSSSFSSKPNTPKKNVFESKSMSVVRPVTAKTKPVAKKEASSSDSSFESSDSNKETDNQNKQLTETETEGSTNS